MRHLSFALFLSVVGWITLGAPASAACPLEVASVEEIRVTNRDVVIGGVSFRINSEQRRDAFLAMLQSCDATSAISEFEDWWEARLPLLHSPLLAAAEASVPSRPARAAEREQAAREELIRALALAMSVRADALGIQMR